jgi:hypothetical protein
MRWIFAGATMLLASTAVIPAAQVEKHNDVQTLMSHRQPQVSRDKIGVDSVHPDEDALSKRIEEDKIRLDRLIDICPSC